MKNLFLCVLSAMVFLPITSHADCPSVEKMVGKWRAPLSSKVNGNYAITVVKNINGTYSFTMGTTNSRTTIVGIDFDKDVADLQRIPINLTKSTVTQNVLAACGDKGAAFLVLSDDADGFVMTMAITKSELFIQMDRLVDQQKVTSKVISFVKE